VFASDEILPTVDQSIANGPTALDLMVSADLHWRRKEWQAAIEAAWRVLYREPKDFHALSIIVTSYGHLQQFDAALPYAKRLLTASPPSWTVIKVVITLLNCFRLFTANGRASHRREMLRCEEEAQVDREALGWAKELLLKQEAANDPVAV
jgi:hypothetical protein